ncbi:MAG TPA: glycosyltransferase family 87 protein [Nitrospira sp.]|nr:glycosyltransferase family 87 protein [Nitrospira sp.]
MTQGTEEPGDWRGWSLLVWGAVFLALPFILWATFPNRTVAGLYRDASEAWWARQGLYTGPGGMNYLPHFAILFTPFQFVPRFAGELLWRWASVGCLLYGWWRLSCLADPQRKGLVFFGSSVIAMAACGDAFRSGQANTMFAAMVLLAASYLIQQRWWPAAVSLMLAVAIKPLGIALAALVLVGYRPMIRPLAVSFAGFVIFPFVFAPTDYVLEQFQGAWTNLVNCSLVTEHRFADVNGILRSLGWELSGTTNQVIRVAAGGTTAVIWLVLSKQPGLVPREFILLALAVSYLMLFNPMTEVNSYVILAPGFAILGMYLIGRPGGRVPGGAMLLGVLTIGIFPELMRRMVPRFGLWWDPVVTLVCLSVFLRYACGSGQKEGQPLVAKLVSDLPFTKDRIGA